MNIGVIIASTRPNRVGGRITDWILSSITTEHALNFEVIDLAAWDLPLFNEPNIPAKGEQYYTNDKTKQWSKKIGSKDGFIFVTPQYNWGYPASLKNAVDYLFNEWTGKPAVIASYANRGGGKAAAQFRQVLEGFRMRPVETMPAINLAKDMYTDDGAIKQEFGEFGHLYSEIINKAIKELEQELNKN
ncbi:flavoprotein [Backusella circina FSU 941]|nr:flavoprotein [Backusella circina FSU 941]